MTVKKLSALLMAVGFLAILCIFGSAQEPAQTSSVLEEHYEAPSDSYATVYGAPALYRLAFEEEPSETVLEYLTYMSGVRFYVSDSVSANVHAFYREGVLTVEATAYTYMAQNGASVTFTPVSLTFDGETMAFESIGDQNYSVSRNCTEEQADLECRVTYTSQFTLGDAVLEELLNGAFRQGVALQEAQKEYDRALAEYEEASVEFEEYQDKLAKYDEDKALYEDYSREVQKYESQSLAYEEYLSKKETYDALLAEYESYEAASAEYEQKKQEYDAYVIAKEKYESDYIEYRETTTLRTAEAAKLYAVNSSYVYSRGDEIREPTTMYSTLMSGLVNTVIANKDSIILEITNGYDGLSKAIDAADIATRNLKVLLTDYKACETVDEQYAYYAKHYEEIRDNYCSLYSSLDHLFDNAFVQKKLKEEDRYERYKEFIAQLFVISTCLDDTVTLDTSAVIADGDRIKDLIFDRQLLKDTDRAEPSLDALPSVMQEPIAPDKVDKPTAPKKVMHPGEAPPEVKHPGNAPTPVQMPTRPSDVEQPIPPASLQRNDSEERLYQAVKNGTLQERTYQGDATFSIFCTTVTVASMPERVTVSYYDSDRKTLLYMSRVEEGNGVFYGGETPTKSSDHYSHYEFIGFVDQNGRQIEDGTVFSSDTCLYAQYRVIPITYTVTFTVGEKTYTSTCVYGQLPNVPTETEKKSDQQYHYVFDGWNTSVTYVTGDAEYEALYRKVERMYKVSFVAKGEVLTQEMLPYGAMPEFCGTLPRKQVTDRYIESFARWTPTLSAVTGNAVYTAVYRQLYYGYDAQNQPLTATLQENNVLEILNTTDTFNNGGALEYACESNTDLRLLFPAGTVLITHENAKALLDAEALSLVLKADGFKRNFRVILKNSQTPLSCLFALSFDVSDILREDATFRIYELLDDTKKAVFFTLDAGTVSLNLHANTQILLANEFTVDVSVGEKPSDPESETPTLDPEATAPSQEPSQEGTAEKPPSNDGAQPAPSERATDPENETAESEDGAPTAAPNGGDDGDTLLTMEGGSVSVDLEYATAGDPVTITVQPDYGYYLKSLTVWADGQEIALQNLTFVMPNAPVEIKAEFAKRTYVLRYLDKDGTVLFEKTLTFFDEEPTVDAPEDEEHRVFDGWEKAGSAEEGTLTYTARYREIVYADPDTSYKSDYGGWHFKDLIPHAVITVTCIGALIAFVCVFKIRKKKKNSKAKE